MNKTAKLLILICAAVPFSLRAEEVKEITIEAFIDGPSALHIRPNSIFWENGENAKPGRANMLKEPTYVNGIAWKPHWKDEKHDRGKDQSSPYQIAIGTADLDFELLAVTQQRGQTGLEQRTPVVAARNGGEFIITIPDPESGQRWYKFVLRKRTK